MTDFEQLAIKTLLSCGTPNGVALAREIRHSRERRERSRRNPPRPVVEHDGVWTVGDDDFATTDRALATAVAAELDRIDPLPNRHGLTSATPRRTTNTADDAAALHALAGAHIGGGLTLPSGRVLTAGEVQCTCERCRGDTR